MSQSQKDREYRERQLVINLPDLSHTDLVDMIRVLQAITDAFIIHHQAALNQQGYNEQQLELFCAVDEDYRTF